MPTSVHHNINTIVTLVSNLQPQRVLDIGCGFGKYGVLMREYLDVWNERIARDEWKVELTAVEAFNRYRNPIHDFVYDKVHYGDAMQIVPTLGDFDAILMLDVIEHLEKARASELVESCLAKSPVLLVSTPSAFYPQEDVNHNPFEVHRCLWTQHDFSRRFHVRTIRTVACNIFVVSRTRLPESVFALATAQDVVYLQSRQKLGWLGLPLSLLLRGLCRLLS